MVLLRIKFVGYMWTLPIVVISIYVLRQNDFILLIIKNIYRNEVGGSVLYFIRFVLNYAVFVFF